ncbi:MAG: hypothetical protein IT287_07615 [Bdellovibrionaceae bacterium]|nr:hypothetical protein [Pseudobdellovibrionaceae bacterium]
MSKVRTFLKYIIAVVVVLFVGLGVVKNYSWLFAKSVEGEVFKVERVTNPTMVVNSQAGTSSAMMHSFAVAVKTADGMIYTASTEDRQWAVVVPGCMVKALFFRYPFWELDKGGTYFNARLDEMKCPSAAAPAVQAPETAAPVPASEAVPSN